MAKRKRAKKVAKEEHKCPKCGEEFHPAVDSVMECPVCGEWGSTACCNSGGVGVRCVQCEEKAD